MGGPVVSVVFNIYFWGHCNPGERVWGYRKLPKGEGGPVAFPWESFENCLYSGAFLTNFELINQACYFLIYFINIYFICSYSI